MVDRTDNNSRQVHPAKTNPKQSAKTCRVRRFFFGAILFAVIALLWAHRIPLQYTGTAIFERRKDPAFVDTSLAGSESFDSRKESLRYDLASREAVEKAVEAMEMLGLTKYMERERGVLTEKGKSTKQQLVREYSEKIKINWEVSSDQIDLVSVSFTYSDPQLAEDMPNTLLANYINRVSMQAAERLMDSKRFLESQVWTCSDMLNALIRKQIEFEEKNKGVIPDNPSTLLEKIFQIRADLDAARLQYQVATQELKSLQGLEQSMTGSADDPNEPKEVQMTLNPLLAQREAELQFTKDILDDALAVTQAVGTTVEKNPTLQMLRLKITRLEERIKETETMVESEFVYERSADNPAAFLIEMLRAKATVMGIQGEIIRLEYLLKTYESILSNFGPIRQKYLELTKKIEYKQDELSRWEERLQSVHMALSAEMAQCRIHLNVMQAAQESFRPQSPSLARIFLITLCGALVVGGISTVLPLRFRLPGRIIIIVLIVILLLAVGFLATSITMKINHPDQYQEWRASPLKFFSEHEN